MQSNIVTADQYLLGGINEGQKGEWITKEHGELLEMM